MEWTNVNFTMTIFNENALKNDSAILNKVNFTNVLFSRHMHTISIHIIYKFTCSWKMYVSQRTTSYETKRFFYHYRFHPATDELLDQCSGQELSAEIIFGALSKWSEQPISGHHHHHYQPPSKNNKPGKLTSSNIKTYPLKQPYLTKTLTKQTHIKI